ncbi:MAG: hypothetical protein AAFR87_32335, partial [Bacteroidota bacterium]
MPILPTPKRVGTAEPIGSRGGKCGWFWALRFLPHFIEKVGKEPNKKSQNIEIEKIQPLPNANPPTSKAHRPCRAHREPGRQVRLVLGSAIFAPLYEKSANTVGALFLTVKN